MVRFPPVFFFFCRPRVCDAESNTYLRNGLIPLIPQGLKISLVAKDIYTTLGSTWRCVTSSLSHLAVAHLRRRVIRALERLQNQVLPILVMGRPVRSGGGRIYEKKDGITWKSTSTKKEIEFEKSEPLRYRWTRGVVQRPQAPAVDFTSHCPSP